MRPLEIVFSGLNSYREQQTVDFGKLGEYGLFGIFGPTGAGKSTVLDAITLALYGEVTRSGGRPQGIIHINEKQCYVRFSFSMSGHNYCVERVLERRKDSPFSVVTGKCRLYDIDNETVITSDKATELNSSVKELIGLDFGHFSQAVILPQGKFDTFLRLTPGDRGQAMEKLFHLDEYGDKLYKKAKKAQTAAETSLALCNTKTEMLGDCSEEKIKGLEEELRETTAQLDKAQADLDAAEKVRERQRNSDKIAAQAANIQNALAELTNKQEYIEELKNHLARAQSAATLEKPLGKVLELMNQVTACTTQEQDMRSVHEINTAALQKAQSDYELCLSKSEMRLPEISKKQILLGQIISKEDEYRQILSSLKDNRIQATRLETLFDNKRLTTENTADKLNRAELRQRLLGISSERAFKNWQREEGSLKELLKNKSAVVLAAGLEAGTPCPVCGSINHPLPANEEETQEVSLIETRLNRYRRDRQILETSLSLLSPVISEHRKNLSATELEVKDAQIRLNNIRQNLEQSELQLSKAGINPQAEQTATASELNKLNYEAEEIRAKLKVATQKLDTARDAERESGNRYTAATAALAEKSLTYEEAKNGLLIETAKLGFASANEAKKSLLPPQEISRLEAETGNYQKDLNKQQSLYNEYNAQLSAINYDPAATKPAEDRYAELNSLSQNLLTGHALLTEQLRQAKDNILALRRIADESKDLVRQSELAGQLAKLFKGRAFVRFLAREHLDEIVAGASATIAGLTGGRYRLEIFEDTAGSDFIMSDNYNGGERRPVNTLSGGEIFLLSLSLALALSEKIQLNGAPLEFFFLDEGFGTLDTSLMDGVMETLERLPNNSRIVGIISHVQEIKTRLPRYLEIKATDGMRGSSIKMITN